MSCASLELLAPRILVVDDESQIHASLRLRLGRECDVTCCFGAREALARVEKERFDLCIVDIHMPEMDGLSFIAAAKQRDPALGYLLLSAFDSDENLRRSIPLHVYDFIAKPLPGREGFEQRIPEWVQRTRSRRLELELAHRAGRIAGDLGAAQLEREVELVASETAREALLQTANLLTTIHAHLVTASAALAERGKSDSTLAHLCRNLEEARKTADAAMAVAEGFFDSAYGSRDQSPALVNAGLRHAIAIAVRAARAEQDNKAVDCGVFDAPLPIKGISGVDFLLMMVPAMGVTLTLAPANSTVRVHAEAWPRLENAAKDARLNSFLWINRRNAVLSQPGVVVSLAASGPAFSREDAEAWLKGECARLSTVTAQGLLAGLQKCRGLLGLALAPGAGQFRLALFLPT
jgi:CheY-like chemotaxis protein